MTDLKCKLIEKQEIVLTKEKELNYLIKQFLDSTFPNQEFNIELTSLVAKRDISFLINTKKNNLIVNIVYNKDENTHKNSYYMQECFGSDESMKELADIINYVQQNLKIVITEDVSIFIKSYTVLQSAITRLHNQIRELTSDISKQGNQKYISAIKSYLCSEKDIISKDKKDFVSKEEHSKKLVFFKLEEYGKKTLHFKEGTLTVKIQSGKKRFEFNRNMISKKEALNIIEYQIFNENIQVTSYKKTPFYIKPSVSSYHYFTSSIKHWNIDLDKYLEQVKTLLIQMKLIDF